MSQSGTVFMTEGVSTQDSILLTESELNTLVSDAFKGGVAEGRKQVQGDIDATEKVNAELRLELEKLELSIDETILRRNDTKKVVIGNNATDLITNYSGVVTAICEYANGVKSALIEDDVTESKMPTEKWVSIDRLYIEEK